MVSPVWGVGVSVIVVVVEEGSSVAEMLGLVFCFGPLFALFSSCLVVLGGALPLRFLVSTTIFLAGVGGAATVVVVDAAEISGGSGFWLLLLGCFGARLGGG